MDTGNNIFNKYNNIYNVYIKLVLLNIGRLYLSAYVFPVTIDVFESVVWVCYKIVNNTSQQRKNRMYAVKNNDNSAR